MLSRVGVEGEHQLHLLYPSHCKQQRLATRVHLNRIESMYCEWTHYSLPVTPSGLGIKNAEEAICVGGEFYCGY